MAPQRENLVARGSEACFWSDPEKNQSMTCEFEMLITLVGEKCRIRLDSHLTEKIICTSDLFCRVSEARNHPAMEETVTPVRLGAATRLNPRFARRTMSSKSIS